MDEREIRASVTAMARRDRQRLTERGWLVVGWATAVGFVAVLGVVGYIEGLS